jgi:hypothetical protein
MNQEFLESLALFCFGFVSPLAILAPWLVVEMIIWGMKRGVRR